MSSKRYDVALNEYLSNHRIEAIKSLRLIFDLSLRDAKDKVDSMGYGKAVSFLLNDGQKDRMIEQGFVVYGHKAPVGVKIFCPDDGRKIEAIKKLRYCTGLGLKETKDIMDEMWQYNRPIDIGKVNEYTVVQLRQHGFVVTGWIDDHFDNGLFEI